MTIVNELTLAVNAAIDNAFPKRFRTLVLGAIALISIHTIYELVLKEPTQDLSLSLLRTEVAVLKSEADMRGTVESLTDAIELLNEQLKRSQDAWNSLQATSLQLQDGGSGENRGQGPKASRP